MGRHTDRSTFAACVAQLAGVEVSEVPLDAGERRIWLAGRGLGLVPVAAPEGFEWAGWWIAERGPQRLACLMFGVPSGPVFEPAGASDEPIVAGWVLTPLDVSLWTPPAAGAVGEGVVEQVLVAADAQGPVRSVDAAVAVPGRGLEGDRYWAGTGTFASGRPGSDLTLIDGAVLDTFATLDHRRNVVVRGLDVNALVGHEFWVGEVRCAGQRLAEPCAALDRANGGGVLRPLVHRAGVRATILSAGVIRVGDPVRPARPPAGAG